MTAGNNNPPLDAVEQAMNTVLQAERSAEDAIADCKQEALRTVQAAQERAQQIATRTDERLALCHMRCTARVSRELKARQRAETADGQGQPTHQPDDKVLAALVAAVARDLIGSTQAESDDPDASK